MNPEKRLLVVLCLFIFLTEQPLKAQKTTNSGFSDKIKTANRVLNKEYFSKTSAVTKYDESGNNGDGQSSLTYSLEKIKKKIAAVSTWLKRTSRSADSISLGDTLVIGFEPGEELVIDSDWIHNGPILVIGDGMLRFEGAHATIIGDVITAENGQLIADSSYLFFPQDYFYQRILLLTGNSEMHFRNSTLDFGGLTHNMATVGTSVLELDHVQKPDFSTVSMYQESRIVINTIDLAGEFIVDDAVQLEISNAEMVLVWHQLGEGALIDWEFPDGESVAHYEFDDQQTNVSGVDYHIQIDDSRGVMWGLMPSNGSDVTISNSDIRTIGLWFEGADSSAVSGLVNNNHYNDFTVPLTDRNFHLLNSDVMTWSLYSFDDAYVDVSGCILGEIGVMGRSQVNATNYYCDGSGGYLWAGDTTFLLSAMSSLASPLRTTQNAIAIFAYSMQINGQVQALDQSILMLLQSNVSSQPTYDPGAVVWMANLTGPVTGYQNSTVDIRGSSWIDKGSESELMDFGYYVMYYRKEGDAGWQMIGDTNYQEVRDNVLINWNTENLDAGTYFLRMDLYDDLGNGITANSQITLLPEVLGTSGLSENNFHFKTYPNPARSTLHISYQLETRQKTNLKIYNMQGREVAGLVDEWQSAGDHHVSFNASELPAGIYYAVIKAEKQRSVRKVAVY